MTLFNKFNIYKNSIALISDIVELNIGHFIIANSIFDGLENSILKMRNIISEVTK